MRIEFVLINTAFAMVSAIIVLFSLRFNNFIYNHNRKAVFVVLFALLNGTLSSYISTLGNFINVFKPFMLIILSVVIIKFVLGTKLVVSITAFLLLSLGMGVGDSFNVIMFGLFDISVNDIVSNPFYYIIANISSSLFALLFLLLPKPISSIIKHVSINKDFTIMMIFTIIIITANAGLFLLIDTDDIAALTIITILSIIYCVYVLFNSFILYKRSIEQIEREQQDFYNKSLENSLFNLRRFRHDWNNNLSVIYSLLSMNKIEETKQYLKEIIEYKLYNIDTTSLFNIKNAGLFGLISLKQNQARDKGLDIIVEGVGEITTIPKIKVSELCEIIGIFLDNAIEESEKVKENIEFSFYDTEASIEIKIKNKCQSEVDLSRLGSYTTKGSDRGSGLRIVDGILSKYKHIHNSRSFKKDEMVFEQILVIEKGV